MAIYGRFKEKWDPLKLKSKVTKNRTFSNEKTGSTYDPDNSVRFYMNLQDIDGTDVIGPKMLNSGMTGYEDHLMITGGDIDPTLVRIQGSRFEQYAVQFQKDGSNRSFIRSKTLDTLGLSISDFTSGTHSTVVSFWVNIASSDFASSGGQFIGGLYRNVIDEADNLADFDPAVLFNVNSSGSLQVRMIEPIVDTNESDGVSQNATVWTTDIGANAEDIATGEWTHVSVVFTQLGTWPVPPGYLRDNQLVVYINGNRVAISSSTIGTGYVPADPTADILPLEVRFGNSTRGFRDGLDTMPADGFEGSIGEFLVYTKYFNSAAELYEEGKMLYEAQRTGAFQLHSGVHSASARVQQIDLDRDSYYPPIHTMRSFQTAEYADDVMSVSKQSVSHFHEGHRSTDVYEEKASKYFINSSDSTLPYLKLNYDDDLLTVGDWYSDDRSEFFEEDLQPFDPDNGTYGFGLAGVQSRDELYREHAVETQGTSHFLDRTAPQEFSDCRVIEIPLVNLADLRLGTDDPDAAAQENAEFSYDSVTTDYTSSDSNQSCNTMAYYNFKNKQWDKTTDAWTTHAGSKGFTNWVDGADIGFGPMSGLVLPLEEDELELYVDNYGRPTTAFGFPFHEKFKSSDGQTIDLSEYIDEDVILDGWEIYVPVIPKVGYQQDLTGQENTDADGPSGFFNNGSGKTPFYYGAHGESIVLWDSKNYSTPFEKRDLVDGSDTWSPNGTIPVGNFTNGQENIPAIDAQGIVTKGVTAFLMKETRNQNISKTIEKWVTTSNDIYYSLNFLGEDPTWPTGGQPTDGIIGFDINLNPAAGQDPGGDSDYAFPQLSSNWFDGDESQREIIGYQQHVFHNDPSWNKQRKYFQRMHTATNTFVGAKPSWRPLSFETYFSRENSTYVEGLLRKNTDQFIFHTSGSMKNSTPYENGYPYTNFKMASDNSTLPYFEWSEDPANPLFMPAGSPAMYSFGVSNNSPGSIAAEFVQYDSIPVIAGKEKSTLLSFPEMSIPNNGVTGTGTLEVWKSACIADPTQVSKTPNVESDVILSPSDKLILGMQDSVSTTAMSQQIIGDDASGGNGFIRWGRNSLVIPETKDAYLRLYIRKTRKDKSFNISSSDTTYNRNVNTSFGDHEINDTYQVAAPEIYSGSMSDDIVGPTYFTAPDIVQSAEYATGQLPDSPIYLQEESHASFAALFSAFYVRSVNPTFADIDYYFPGIFSDGGYSSRNVQVSDFELPWSSLSKRLFDNSLELPVARMVMPLEDGQNPTPVIQDTILSSLQSVIVHPEGLTLGNSSYWANTLPNSADTGLQRVGCGLISVIEELNDLDVNPTDFDNYAWTDSIGNNYTADFGDNEVLGNAASGWFLSLSFPVVQSVTNQLEPTFSTVPVKFRYVRIGTVNQQAGFGTQLLPQYSDGTDMAIGDAFYFDNVGNCIKLLQEPELITDSNRESQKWARKWQGVKTEGQTIYIIGAMHENMVISNLTEKPIFPTESQNNSVYSWKQIYSIIAKVMTTYATVDDGVLWTHAYSSEIGTALTVQYPDDPIVRFVMNNFESDINTANHFVLSGRHINDGDPMIAAAIYLQAHPDDVSRWFDTDWYNHVEHGGSQIALQWSPDGGSSYTWLPDPSNKIVKGYLRTNCSQYPDTEDSFSPTLIANNPAGGDNFAVDFTGTPDDIKISITTETFTEKAPQIDRKVVFRTSENTAGPFGSLNKFSKVSSSDLIYDSVAPAIDELLTSSIDLHESGYSLGWLLENQTEKTQRVVLNDVKARVSLSSSGFDTVAIVDNTPIVHTTLTNGDLTWTPATVSNSSSAWPFDYTNGSFSVMNYIQSSFAGLRDYSIKTGRDLVLGFGNNIAGTHTIRPRPFDYEAFQQYDPDTGLTDSTSNFQVVADLAIDPPRGARFGLYNVSSQSSSYIYSLKHYGHLRDMFEQALDTKRANANNNEEVLGSPVVVSAVNPVNPESPKLMSETLRYNKTVNATIVKPYIEDNYESTPEPVQLNTENLRVDVAGSIRSRQITGPGRMASTIRRRS